MYLSHKIKLQPTKNQEVYFRKACGVSRFAYNWALEHMELNYQNNIKSTGYDLSKQLNTIKRQEFPWMLEVTKWAPQKSVYDLYQAYKNWWNAKQKGNKNIERPVYKKKGYCTDSFYLTGQNCFRIEKKKIYISKLGYVRTTKPLRFQGKLLSVTISRRADNWYASVSVELDEDTFVYSHTCENQDVVGIDLGIKSLITLSNGKKVDPIKAYYTYERKLVKLSKEQSRRKKGSNNRKKTNKKIARLHFKISNIRNNYLHEISSYLVKNFRYIGVENLNIKGMLQNHKLAKSISDCSWLELIRQLEHKAQLSRSNIIKADRWFASSKICNECGYKKEDLNLRDRSWICPDCGINHDRDINSALHMEKVARGYRDTINACGDGINRLPCEARIGFKNSNA